MARARALLRKAGLTVATATKAVGVASDPQIGAVAGTTPSAGTSVAENQPVSVNVVAGLVLPNLVGQNIDTIQKWAGQNDVPLQITQVGEGQPQGTVPSQSPAVSQSPAPGTLVRPRQTVSVSVVGS